MTGEVDSKNARQFSLRLSLSGAFALMVMLTTVLLGASTFVSVQRSARQDLREHLGNFATMAARQVDPALHAGITAPEQETSETYLKIKAALQAIRDADPRIRFAYTYRGTEDGGIAFAVDAETNPEEVSHVGDPYEDATETMRQALEAPFVVRVEEEFATDEWGTWLSAFAPIKGPDGKLEAVLGLDVSAANVLDYERRYLMRVALVSLLVAALAIAFGYWVARMISAPLSGLAADMGRIQRLELSGGADLGNSRIAEVSLMVRALEDMKKGLRSFRKYVPADVVAELLARHQEAVVGAERANLTVMFTDIADFTTIAEHQTPEEIARHLGWYFEAMTRALLASQATIDKFIGDSVMVFWGAPRPLSDHAERACLAALACQRYVKEAAARVPGAPPFVTRFGINTGEAIVGNIGFEERLSYTAVGDQVNLASRLEGLNKFYGTSIVMSEATYRAAKNAVESRLLDLVVVKGRSEPVPVYEVLGERGKLDDQTRRRIETYEKAFALYQARDWRGAAAGFQKAYEIDQNDTPARRLAERCAANIVTPPGDDWQGAVWLRDK